MAHFQDTIEIPTSGRGCFEVTAQVSACVAASRVQTGLCVVFCRHTSCSLVIGENADPSVQSDLLAWLERICPDGDPRYAHDAEGPDDMPAHLRSTITRTSENIPIVAGALALGTWQGIYLLEHRTRAHRRRLIVHVSGDE